MKTSAIVLAATVLVGTAVKADELGVYCSSMAQLAEGVASAHQAGVSLGVLLSKMEKTIAPEGQSATRSLIVAIYDRPRFRTEENQKQEIADVRDEMHVECLKSVKLTAQQ